MAWRWAAVRCLDSPTCWLDSPLERPPALPAGSEVVRLFLRKRCPRLLHTPSFLPCLPLSTCCPAGSQVVRLYEAVLPPHPRPLHARPRRLRGGAPVRGGAGQGGLPQGHGPLLQAPRRAGEQHTCCVVVAPGRLLPGAAWGSWDLHFQRHDGRVRPWPQAGRHACGALGALLVPRAIAPGGALAAASLHWHCAAPLHTFTLATTPPPGRHLRRLPGRHGGRQRRGPERPGQVGRQHLPDSLAVACFAWGRGGASGEDLGALAKRGGSWCWRHHAGGLQPQPVPSAHRLSAPPPPPAQAAHAGRPTASPAGASIQCTPQTPATLFLHPRRWYSQAGTPRLTAVGTHNPSDRTYTLRLSQVWRACRVLAWATARLLAVRPHVHPCSSAAPRVLACCRQCSADSQPAARALTSRSPTHGCRRPRCRLPASPPRSRC